MDAHTSHSPPVQQGSDRSFGIVFAVVFLIIGVLPVFTGGDARVWSLSLSGAFLITAMVRSCLLSPLNHAWTRFGLLLNRIVSPIALLIVYCVAVVPTALMLRIARKDLLRLHSSPKVTSYWVMRKPPSRPDGQMRQQF